MNQNPNDPWRGSSGPQQSDGQPQGRPFTGFGYVIFLWCQAETWEEDDTCCLNYY